MYKRIEIDGQGYLRFARENLDPLIARKLLTGLLALPSPVSILAKDAQKNSPVEFWFTESGWKGIGEAHLHILQKNINPKDYSVIVREEEWVPSLDVVYSDEFQIGIIPTKA